MMPVLANGRLSGPLYPSGSGVRAVAVHRTFGDELRDALIGMTELAQQLPCVLAQSRRRSLVLTRRIGQMHVQPNLADRSPYGIRVLHHQAAFQRPVLPEQLRL